MITWYVTTMKNAKNTAVKRSNQIPWLRLAIVVLGFFITSIGLVYVLQNLVAQFHLPLHQFDWLAYLTVFSISLAANLTIITPVPFAALIMIAAATEWNPVLVALFGSVGATLGELSGYYAGYLGRKVALPDNITLYSRVDLWIQHYGLWGILFLAFQPILPFDVAGLIAGAAKMPLRKFLPALWGGRFPKYVLFVYVSLGVIHVLPFWSP
jgi:uncharacterized membrane protein YdjX (TVP38/TMEM64 family)